jgi:hypothetical protein
LLFRGQDTKVKYISIAFKIDELDSKDTNVGKSGVGRSYIS